MSKVSLENKILYTKDTSELFVDCNGARKPVRDQITNQALVDHINDSSKHESLKEALSKTEPANQKIGDYWLETY